MQNISSKEAIDRYIQTIKSKIERDRTDFREVVLSYIDGELKLMSERLSTLQNFCYSEKVINLLLILQLLNFINDTISLYPYDEKKLDKNTRMGSEKVSTDVFKKYFPFFSIKELFLLMQVLDDEGIRCVVNELRKSPQELLYQSITTNNFEDFQAQFNQKDKDLLFYVWLGQFLPNGYNNYLKSREDLLGSFQIKEMIYEVLPVVVEIVELMESIDESNELTAESLKHFEQLYPQAISDIIGMLDTIIEAKRLSKLMNRDIRNTINYYSFLYDGYKIDAFSEELEEHIILHSFLNSLRMVINDILHEPENSLINERFPEKISCHTSSVLKKIDFRLNEFISNNFIMDAVTKEYLDTKYIQGLGTLFEEIKSTKALYGFAFLFFPVLPNGGCNSFDLLKDTQRLTGGVVWNNVPKDLDEVVDKLIGFDEERLKIFTQNFSKASVSPSKNMEYLAKETANYIWIQEFINDFWPTKARNRYLKKLNLSMY